MEPDLISVGDYVKVFFDAALWVEGTVTYKPNKSGEPWIITSLAAIHYIGAYSRISKETPTTVIP